jgi:HAUS augmin-like complex subunit 1
VLNTRYFCVVVQDKALAELAIEDKRREIEAAEKYLEDALQSALNTPSE